MHLFLTGDKESARFCPDQPDTARPTRTTGCRAPHPKRPGIARPTPSGRAPHVSSHALNESQSVPQTVGPADIQQQLLSIIAFKKEGKTRTTYRTRHPPKQALLSARLKDRERCDLRAARHRARKPYHVQ